MHKNLTNVKSETKLVIHMNQEKFFSKNYLLLCTRALFHAEHLYKILKHQKPKIFAMPWGEGRRLLSRSHR